MDTGSEITAKIRSAIKAKLVELGAYVDDELPDYIMVMIANKKTKEQMSNDLSLFLGKNSAIFTDWVHSVLERLQSISQKSAKMSQDHSVSSKGSKDKKQTLVRNERKEEREKRNDASSSKDAPELTVSRREKGKKDNDLIPEKKQRHKRIEYHSEEKKLKIKNEKVEERASKEEIVEKCLDISAEMVDLEMQKHARSLAKKNKSEKETHHRHRKAHSSSKKSVRKITCIPISNGTTLEEHRMESLTSTDTSSAILVPKDHKLRLKREAPSSSSSDRDLQPKRRSVVGQVLQRRVEEEDYEIGYTKSLYSVQSTVRVTERKNKLPETMQPKPTIFLKALNEANASMSRRRRAKDVNLAKSEEIVVETPEVEEYEPPDPSSACLDVDMSDNDKVPFYVPTPIKKAEETSPSTNASLIINKTQFRDSRRVEYGEDTVQRLAADTSSDVVVADDTLIVDLDVKENKPDGPRFFVTLDGVSSAFVDKVKTCVGGQSSNNVSMAESDVDVISDNEDNVDHPAVAVATVAASKQTAATASATNAVDTQHVESAAVDDDAILLDYDEEELAVGVSGGESTPNTIRSQINEIKICLDDDEEENEDDEQHFSNNKAECMTANSVMQTATTVATTSATLVTSAISVASPTEATTVPTTTVATFGGDKLAERCRFWPSCKSGSLCPYQHPTTACKAFPTCRFGDRCMYIHPKCRYDPFCTNQRCPFSHTTGTAPPTVSNVIAAPIPLCKFGGRCTNPGCGFKHPKPCVYGANCFRPDCIFSHPAVAVRRPKVIGIASTAGYIKHKFKWVATSTTNRDATAVPSVTMTS